VVEVFVMDLMKAFQDVCGDFPTFRSHIVAARELAQDPGVRAELDQAISRMDQSFAEFKQTFPKAVDEVKQTMASAEAKANEASQMLAAAEQQRAQAEEALKASAEAAARPQAPAVVVPQPIDLKLVAQLRQELLERFAGWRKRPDGTGQVVDREIWEDWDEN
jgi:hypothetical protein